MQYTITQYINISILLRKVIFTTFILDYCIVLDLDSLLVMDYRNPTIIYKQCNAIYNNIVTEYINIIV